ncbi:MAG: glycoside hydrolase family 65 protein [Myxococcota bacterium]
MSVPENRGDLFGGQRLRRYHVPRARLIPPEHIYPVDEWRIVEKRFYPRFLAQTETIFALANGYMGMRGDFEEGSPVRDGGVFVNGFHETWPIFYSESAYGFAKTGQTIVNVPDGRGIRLYIDDESFDLASAQIRHFERSLDMREGLVRRELEFETASGKQVRVRSRRMASAERRHLAVIDYEVTVLDAPAIILLASELVNRAVEDESTDGDPRKAHRFDARVLETLNRQVDELRVTTSVRTKSSRMELASGIDHLMDTECPWQHWTEHSDEVERVIFSVDAAPGRPVRLTKLVAAHHGRGLPTEELSARAGRTLTRAKAAGRDQLFSEQRQRLTSFWERSDVQIDGEPALQQSVRFNLFQLFQATARVEGHGVSAKGLTGRGYEGHYFWDADVYVMPFLTYTAPRQARNLLSFRYRMLEGARARARELSHRGALFPWRTISGEEASAYYAAGTAQYHINADIAYALRKYVNATGDEEFLIEKGAEMLVETARLWADLGFFSEPHGGAFCINGVTGPDEYTAVVNNNCFTNLMARDNLRAAASVCRAIQKDSPAAWGHLCHETGVEPGEIETWEAAAAAMFLPLDETTGVHAQDDSFLEKEVWNFAGTPQDKYPLLLHFHPLTLYRHQVIKQADVVLAMFLLDRDFSTQQKKRNFDYYEPLTTGDSSLSSSIESIVASEIGYHEKAFGYFLEAAVMDLADVSGNVNDGVHIASAGGVWMACVYGFAGMRDENGVLSFAPRLPESFDRLAFPITWGGRTLDVEITRHATTYRLRSGPPIQVRHRGEVLDLHPGEPREASSGS